MTEIWESTFRRAKAMWGIDPADSALAAAKLFDQIGLKKILIPGFGYGRNAKAFTDRGARVTGIEISETAIALAYELYGKELNVYHGSVTEMPFDSELYDGIFCYALVHLLNSRERKKLIQDCYNQLAIGGQMIFVAISTSSPNYGGGKWLSTNRFRIASGVSIYFYDHEAIIKEFVKFGLVHIEEIEEPVKNDRTNPPFRFWFVTCQKQAINP